MSKRCRRVLIVHPPPQKKKCCGGRDQVGFIAWNNKKKRPPCKMAKGGIYKLGFWANRK